MAKKKRRKRQPPVASNGHGKGSAPGAKPPVKLSSKEQGLLQVPKGQGATVFPPMRGSLGRGFYAAGANLVLLLTPMLLVFFVWVVLLVSGQRFFPPGLATILAIPPLGSGFDVQTSLILFGFAQTGLLAFFVLTVIRSIVWAVLIGMLDEMMEYRVVSRVGLLRGLRAFPAVLLYDYLCLGIVLGATYILPSFFGQLGGVLSLALLMGAVFFLVFAPIAAVRLQLTGRESVMRAIKGARLPGWPRHLLMSVVYFLVAVYVLQLAHPEPLAITANPSFRTWVFILFATYVQVGFLGAFIDRWKAVEGYVPQQTKPRAAPAPRQRRR